MRYKFLATIKIATTELGLEYDEYNILQTPAKTEVKTFIVLTDEGYHKAKFSAICSVCEYIRNHYHGQETNFSLMIAN